LLFVPFVVFLLIVLLVLFASVPLVLSALSWCCVWCVCVICACLAKQIQRNGGLWGHSLSYGSCAGNLRCSVGRKEPQEANPSQSTLASSITHAAPKVIKPSANFWDMAWESEAEARKPAKPAPSVDCLLGLSLLASAFRGKAHRGKLEAK
jgi:hypothetical protein